MAFKVADRIQETSTTTGTGTYSLDGAATGFQAFSVLGAGATTGYFATDDTNWEVGIGTVGTGPSTLARTTILASSNGGSAVNWGAGTRRLYCSLPSAFSPRKEVATRTSNTKLAAADHKLTIRATGSWTQTFDPCATLGDGWAVKFINEGTGTITFDPDSSETIEGLTSIVFRAGESGDIVCNGSALKVMNRSRYAGAIGSGRNIAARTNSSTPNSKIDITADELQLKDSNGNPFVATSVSVTIDITASGANGLDTGAEGSSTWYYGWVIYNPASNTVAGLLSTSATAPTMPSGYTFKALVAAVRNDGSSNFIAFRQFGNEAFYESRQSVLNSGTSTSEATVSASSLVPSVATKIALSARLVLTNAGGSSAVGSATLRYISSADFFALSDYQLVGQTSPQQNGYVEIPNVSQQFFYLVSNGGGGSSPDLTVFVNGFKLPAGGE